MRRKRSIRVNRLAGAIAVAVVALVLIPTASARFGVLFSETTSDPAICSSGARTLSTFGARVYPEMGNGGYVSVHTDLYVSYDTATNLFLPGTHAELTQRATQCLTDFSLDFERTNSAPSGTGPNLTVNAVFVNGEPASFTFKQPTYPGDPNGQDDPDPAAHAVSNQNPVSATNPNPPACSPQVSGNTQNGTQCPANKLVITPSDPIPAGATFTVRVDYSGRPGVHVDGDGSTEGWFRVNTTAAPNDGSFVTTEPVGSVAWMPLNNHPSAKPTYDIHDTVPIGKTAIGPGELVTSQLDPVRPTSVNPPDANFPGGSWTWHWHSPEPIANYLVTNSIGSYDLTVKTSPDTGVQYYSALASGLTSARKTAINAVVNPDAQDAITKFQEGFNGPFPFTTDGVVVALPSVGFAEEMQTKITFGNGASSTPSVGTFHHENMHQWFGDNVSAASFNLTFWKEGWATIGEYLLTARTAANAAGAPGTAAWNTAFDSSLVSRFNTNYGTSSTTFWTVAPSNPTVGNLFTTANTYTRPGTAYLALRQILDGSASRPASDRWIGAMKQIQADFGGRSITKAELEDVFHEWLPNQSEGCHTRLDQFFAQWFDTAYPSGGGSNRPQITGPGLNGPNFYDDNGLCPRLEQSVTFGPLDDRFVTDADFAVSATSTSGRAVSFAASGQCTVTGTTVHLTGAGSCTITASQTGDGLYKPAAAVQRTFSIRKLEQTVSFATLPDRQFGDADFAVSATASSGLGVSFAASGNCTVALSVVHLTGAGSCTVTASQAGNATYGPAGDVSHAFAIAKASQTITFGPVADRKYGVADFAPGATASSGLPVAYAASGSCSTAGGLIHVTAVGSCTVTASQRGDENYDAAADASRTFSVTPAGTSTSVSLAPKSPNPVPQFSDTVTVSATVTPDTTATGDGSFSGTLAFQVNGKPAPAATRTVTGDAPTQVAEIRLDDATVPGGAGTYGVTATFTPDAGGNYAGSSAARTAAVKREGQKGDDSADGSAKIEYGGDQYVVVGGSPNLVATLRQSLAPETADTEYVDFSKSNVSVVFSIFPADCASPCGSTPTWTSGNVKLADRSDWQDTGTGFAQTGGPKLPEGSYVVSVALVANGYVLAEQDQAALTIASVTGTFVTGGGFLPTDSTSNAGTRKGQFAFNIKADKSGLKGSSAYLYRMRMDIAASTATTVVPCSTLTAACRDVDIMIRSNKLVALNPGDSVVYPTAAYATGQMVVQFVDAATGVHYAQFEFGAGTFRLDLTDRASGGATDSYGFTAYRKDGSVFHQASVPSLGALPQNGTGSPTNQATLGGGNTAVHPR